LERLKETAEAKAGRRKRYMKNKVNEGTKTSQEESQDKKEKNN
jgi:hypothetical protein